MTYWICQSNCLGKVSKTFHNSQNNQFWMLISLQVMSIRNILMYVALWDFPCFNFSLALFTSCASVANSSPPCPPPTLNPSNFPLYRKNPLIVETAVCYSVSHSILFFPHFFACKYSLTHWSGTRPLTSATLSLLEPHWDSSQISCCCPMT